MEVIKSWDTQLASFSLEVGLPGITHSYHRVARAGAKYNIYAVLCYSLRQ